MESESIFTGLSQSRNRSRLNFVDSAALVISAYYWLPRNAKIPFFTFTVLRNIVKLIRSFLSNLKLKLQEVRNAEFSQIESSFSMLLSKTMQYLENIRQEASEELDKRFVLRFKVRSNSRSSGLSCLGESAVVPILTGNPSHG